VVEIGVPDLSRVVEVVLTVGRQAGAPRVDLVPAVQHSHGERAQPVANRPIEPHQAIAMLVDRVPVADAAERERPGYGLERLGAYGDANHSVTSPAGA
jgi:hypothetical protein